MCFQLTRVFVLGLLCLLSSPISLGLDSRAPEEIASGVVYDDANHNGRRDAGESGIPDVRVSNGRVVVVTDEDGAYVLPVDDDTIIFVSKPRNWMTPVDELNLPRFYYAHKPSGSPAHIDAGVPPTGPLPAAIDFPLHRRSEPDRFRVLIFGDTQPRSIEDVNYLSHDIIEQVVGIDAAFGFSLGDLVFDRPELFEPVNKAMAHVGIPWYNVLGNHDENYTATDDVHSDESFERVYGPPYYSFDYGPVHFIVLDDVIWHGRTPDKKGYYTSGLGERQMAFLRNDLRLVPKDSLVVLTMHIPLPEIAERVELFKILAERPYAVSFSGHLHIHQQWFLGTEDGWPGPGTHHHTSFVTACGSWWRGAPDEVGLPHTTMRDGAPNGWCVATFDGHEYSIEFRAARRPADYQMSIHAPEVVGIDETAAAEVLVNVFAGSERSTVEMRVGRSPWVKLERVERPDPYLLSIKAAEESESPPNGIKLPKPIDSAHIWLGRLPADLVRGTHMVEVRTTDVFGHTYSGRRIIRVE